MKLTQIAMVAALMLPASYASAQDFDAAGMAAGLSMIEHNVGNALKVHGIGIDPRSLTLSQLVEISQVLNEAGSSSGGVDMKFKIEAALRRGN